MSSRNKSHQSKCKEIGAYRSDAKEPTDDPRSREDRQHRRVGELKERKSIASPVQPDKVHKPTRAERDGSHIPTIVYSAYVNDPRPRSAKLRMEDAVCIRRTTGPPTIAQMEPPDKGVDGESNFGAKG